MSVLGNKSYQEISELLDYYGIKHGPVVDSTRGLYEKKLKEAMTKERKPKTSPDKTYYREEEEEVTYYTYRPPITVDSSRDRGPYMRSRPEYAERAFEDENCYSGTGLDYSRRDFVDEPYINDSTSTYRNVSSQPAPVRSGGDATQTNSSRLIPLWVQFVVFLAVAAFLYFVFSNMESAHSDPFKRVK
ncbi:emerin (Emery-Dreifuss muscular dystrophy) isoform X1 [Lampris incognitus]|uniref:emerin (Emery-Dreifuss muscular dystrophy) isoform X1 n=1 Tax=Lampris incognitus TaxID=2546036 RepID=UPI0024B5295F|nr:emerin (Emery-Dreifuss muscular dystrophy) isoform X1 [Lampris incognitus]